LQPNAWARDWRYPLIHGRSDQRRIPAAARDFLVSFGLPRVIIFEWRSDFEISFSPVEKDLVPYNTTFTWGDFYNEVRDRAWSHQLVIGEEEGIAREPADEADRGRHPGFARDEGLAGGPAAYPYRSAQSEDVMRRSRGEAIAAFFEKLMQGDPVALGFVGFFAVVAAVLGLVMLKVRRDMRREDEASARRYGRQRPK
jgi:hypothetical protein